MNDNAPGLRNGVRLPPFIETEMEWIAQLTASDCDSLAGYTAG
jgi:hypothetical protein